MPLLKAYSTLNLVFPDLFTASWMILVQFDLRIDLYVLSSAFKPDTVLLKGRYSGGLCPVILSPSRSMELPPEHWNEPLLRGKPSTHRTGPVPELWCKAAMNPR